jgi:alpha-D-xyloside xylohydrolase
VKFTDGNWMMQKGVRPFYPGAAHEALQDGNTLKLLATRPIRHRGDTLEGPTLTVVLSSPAEDVVRVRITHFEGGPPLRPTFPVNEVGHAVTIQIDECLASISSGQLTARVNREDWSLEFVAQETVITKSPSKGLGLMQIENGGKYLHDQLTLGVGENVYGLGERFTSFVKNGQSIDMWNEDGGTGSDQAYKNVPFYLTNRGYGVFVNHSGRVSFEVASEKVSRVQFSVSGDELEYFVIYGPSPKEILRKYTLLTGRPALPPSWTFGLWLTTSFTTSYDEATVTEFIQGMNDRDLPLHTFHFDCFWMREFQWCDFQWDPRVFPDPAGMLQRLKDRGLKICVWINPYIGQASPLFAEGKANGFLLKRPDGSVWQWDLWQPGMAIVDFTNLDACNWYANKLRGLVDMGVDSFKTDFGERIPTDVTWHDGSDPERMHNFYPYLYNKVVFEVLEEKLGEGNAAVFARSATAGCQLFPVHWGGDCDSKYESMAESLRGGLSLGLSGFGFWSHDIGGFEGLPDANLYKRWIAFGLLSSHSRLHGSSSYRVPWLFDEEAVDVLRHFTKLKCQLMPYLWSVAEEAHRHGIPMMRAMCLEFPDDPACQGLDRQYMLGPDLLVAPVFSEDGSVEFYLPDGQWVHVLDKHEVPGGRWLRETYDAMSLPLFVRSGTELPWGTIDDRPDYDYQANSTLKRF